MTARYPRGLRGLVRLAAGLALVAVVVGCGSEGGQTEISTSQQVDFAPRTSAPGNAVVDGTVDQSKVPLDPAEGRAEEIVGPYTLRLPTLGVDAPVVPIETGDDRVLLPPRDPTIVGWWSQGVAPGAASGSVVLVGHTVHTGGGVFDDIDTLEAGDLVEVEGASSTLDYRVDSVDVLSKPDLAADAEAVFDQSGPGRLVIVTCDDWDGSAYLSNVVVIATPA